MNQLMKNLRLPVVGLVASTGLNVGGVDAAKVEETFGPKNQSGVQASLVTGGNSGSGETRGFGENLAGKTEGVQVAQLSTPDPKPALLKDLITAANKINGQSNPFIEVQAFNDCDSLGYIKARVGNSGFVNNPSATGIFSNLSLNEISKAMNQGLRQ